MAWKTVALVTLVVAGCSDSKVAEVNTTKLDAGHDLAADLAPDLAADLAPELTPDLAPDFAPDFAPDLAPDLAPVDLAPDITVDMSPSLVYCIGGDCKDFVFSELRFPTDTTQALQYGVDFDNNGTVDNQLGNFLSALSLIAPDLIPQSALTESINRGETIMLMRVQGGDFTNAQPAAAQTWGGHSTICCVQSDPAQCAAEAAQTCFGGSHSFLIDLAAPTVLLGGSISAQEGTFNAPTLEVEIPLSNGVMTLPLKECRIVGTFAGSGITNGKLVGVIDHSDLYSVVLPGIHLMFVAATQDPNSTSTKQLLQIFDMDNDKAISLTELKSNDLFQSLFHGDVDADGDGDYELSIGLGFSAASATIIY